MDFFDFERYYLNFDISNCRTPCIPLPTSCIRPFFHFFSRCFGFLFQHRRLGTPIYSVVFPFRWIFSQYQPLLVLSLPEDFVIWSKRNERNETRAREGTTKLKIKLSLSFTRRTFFFACPWKGKEWEEEEEKKEKCECKNERWNLISFPERHEDTNDERRWRQWRAATIEKLSWSWQVGAIKKYPKSKIWRVKTFYDWWFSCEKMLRHHHQQQDDIA